MQIITYDAYTRLSTLEANRLTNFINDHLEGFSVPKKTIRKSIQYAAKETPGLGGMVFAIEEKGCLIGAAVVNKTGLDDFVPENLLVFLAVHKEHKDRGVGQKLMDYTLQYCRGDIGLLVRADNPAKDFFKQYGFEEHYMEMRLNR